MKCPAGRRGSPPQAGGVTFMRTRGSGGGLDRFQPSELFSEKCPNIGTFRAAPFGASMLVTLTLLTPGTLSTGRIGTALQPERHFLCLPHLLQPWSDAAWRFLLERMLRGGLVGRGGRRAGSGGAYRAVRLTSLRLFLRVQAPPVLYGSESIGAPSEKTTETCLGIGWGGRGWHFLVYNADASP